LRLAQILTGTRAFPRLHTYQKKNDISFEIGISGASPFSSDMIHWRTFRTFCFEQDNVFLWG
jgi:hypothetical protein